MNVRGTSLCALVLGLVCGRTATAAEDIKVCVDVELHAPAAKETEDSKGSATTPTTKTKETTAAQTPEANSPPGTEGAQAATEAERKASAGAQSAPVAAAGTAVLVPFAVPGPPGPRVIAVESNSDAEAAANVASEVDPQGARDARVTSGAHLPVGQTPTAYLRRLMEHFVTHEPGHVAVQEQCAQRIVVQLYPLKVGWTVFARYSGNGREERIDQLLPTELSPFAERSVLALLHDIPISETVDRDNVLWADSLKSTQRIRGRNSVVLGVGTRARIGVFDTVVDDSRDADYGGVSSELRLLTPMALTFGYRGQFEQYGVEALGELDLGTDMRSAVSNPRGGHVDYGGSTGLVIHVLRYLNPRGVASPYFGAGANFALHWFRAITPSDRRGDEPRSTLFGGGLDVDLLAGYEFMRASAVSFFLQGELNLPAYAVRNENNDGRVNTWLPGAALRLGASF